MASQVLDEILPAGGSSDGTFPPGEVVQADVHHPRDNGRRAVYDNPAYHRHHPYQAPASRSAPPVRITGMDPRILARTPPPPPPPQRQTPPLPPVSQPSRESRDGHLRGNDNFLSTPSGDLTRPSGQSTHGDQVHYRASPYSQAPMPPPSRNDFSQFRSTSTHADSRVHASQHMISQDRVYATAGARNMESSQSPRPMESGQIQSHSRGFAQPTQVSGNSSATVLGPREAYFSDSGYSHGVSQQRGAQSGSNPAPKTHPLQQLVDVHNAGPVSAFSQDPSAFTGTIYFPMYYILTSVRTSSEWGLCFWARGSVECELPPSRGWLPPVFF